jgi:hypothetical protein
MSTYNGAEGVVVALNHLPLLSAKTIGAHYFCLTIVVPVPVLLPLSIRVHVRVVFLFSFLLLQVLLGVPFDGNKDSRYGYRYFARKMICSPGCEDY